MTNRSPEKFIEMQTEELLAARMRAMIFTRARVSDAEGYEQYRREKSSAKLDVVTLHKSYFRTRYIDTSPHSVEAWAKSNKGEVDKLYEERKAGFPAGCRRARHIVVAIKSDTAPNRGHAREEAQDIIEKARVRIAAGEDFARVAEEVSEDPATKSKGGDLGCSTRGKWAKEMEDVEFVMKKPGELSDVIETPMGFHVLRLELILSNDVKKAEEQARASIAEELMGAFETETLVAATAKKIREAAAGGKTLEQATSEVMTALDTDKGVDKKEAAEAKKRAEAKKKVDEAKKKAVAAKKDGEDGATAEADEDEPEPDPARPTVETTASFTPDDSPIEGADSAVNVAALAYAAAKPGDLLPDLVKVESGYAVAQLKERTAASREDFEKDREAYMDRFARAKAQDAIVGYLDRLRKRASAEIKVNDVFAREPKDKE